VAGWRDPCAVEMAKGNCPKMNRYLERRALIETSARSMAWSGEHRSFVSIKIILQRHGYEGVDKLFENQWTCSELNRICEQAHALKK
jgi:hypothetical protein